MAQQINGLTRASRIGRREQMAKLVLAKFEFLISLYLCPGVNPSSEINKGFSLKMSARDPGDALTQPATQTQTIITRIKFITLLCLLLFRFVALRLALGETLALTTPGAVAIVDRCGMQRSRKLQNSTVARERKTHFLINFEFTPSQKRK